MTIEVELAAPVFLIAVPQLGDPNFLRAVVLLLEHGDEGSMGMVISRASDLAMGDFCRSQSLEYEGDAAAAVHVGGPVQPERAFILHTPGPEGPETESPMEGLRLSYSLESLRMLTAAPPQHMRVFLGYAGWGPGQLADEITEGAWLLAPPSVDLVFRDPSVEAWERALRELGIEPAQLMHSGAVH